jgi:hypothetical protein
MEQTAGIIIAEPNAYRGNGSTSETIRIVNNRAKNIDGRLFSGLAVPHVEVAWNEVNKLNANNKQLGPK